MSAKPELQIRHLYQQTLAYSGPLHSDPDACPELPDAVRDWIRRARTAHAHLSDDQFLRYLARALPTSVELLQRGFLISVQGGPVAPQPRPQLRSGPLRLP